MNKKVNIIAEIGQAHDGSLGILHSFIDALSDTGVDAIKFQTHIAEAESSEFEPFRINFSYEDNTRFDYWKRMSFNLEQWMGIKAHCDEGGLEFLSSPFSLAAVELLERLGVKRYKIGSGEVSNFLMLEKIARTHKPVILSSGMSAYRELDNAVKFLRDRNIDLSLLQCTTAYPTKPEEVGLNIIEELQERYKLPVGLSDHSGEIYPSLAAVALGATLIEVHVTFDKKMFGPDTSSSLTMRQIEELTKGVRSLERALANPIDKNDASSFTYLKQIFEKSLAVNKNLPAGHVIKFEDLESKKPANKGIAANKYQEIIGKKLKRNLMQWDFLHETDLED